MDRKSNPRQSSAIQRQNGSDAKKDAASRNQRWGRRRGQGASNYSFNEGQVRKPTPQKNKNTWDKRPRPRGELPDRTGGDLEEDVEAEYGSAILSGSKKGNLNHLLNFTYAEHGSSNLSYRGSSSYGSRSRGRQVRYGNSSYSRGGRVFYNKEQFLQANCQFVVKDTGDYSVHMMNPDVLVDWDSIEQVRVLSLETPSCPICLQYPTAAKMTRCGHIYCWSCILHYLALGEKSWRKCPICYEAIQSDDLKSVITREVRNYKVGDAITMTLMKKEKGSIYAVPANLWQKEEKIRKCHNVTESAEMTHHLKLLTANSMQTLDMLEMEGHELRIQLETAESSEEPFIKGAQDQLKARQEKLLGMSVVAGEMERKIEAIEPQQPPIVEVPVIKHTVGAKAVKVYKSAFSDEEDETVVENIADSTLDTTSEMETGSIDTSLASESTLNESSLPDGTDISNTVDLTSEAQVSLAVSPNNLCFPMDAHGQPEIPVDIMPLEEAAEHLEMPSQTDSSGKTRNKSGDQCFYFYQAEDGQHIYLHSLNARCLVRQFGGLEFCPQKITASIVEKESVFVTEELRKRLRYLSHLPLTCGFEVVELDIRPPVLDKDILKHFSEDFEKRKRLRNRKAREEKRQARYIEEQERKKLGLVSGTIVHSQFHQPQSTPVDRRSDTSSPSLDTPVGSPSLGLGTPSPSMTDDGSQTAVVSFAQMLKAGAQAPVWPKAKSDASQLSSQSSGARRAGSDESDNEDKIPVPEYQSSFGSAIEAALINVSVKQSEASGSTQQPGSGKKKKKQLVLFSTSMARGGK